MAEDKVHLSFIDENKEHKSIVRCLKDIKYVEELVNSVLSEQGVQPSTRILFGLRFIDSKIWLAPNDIVRNLNGSAKGAANGGERPKLEIRMRFQSSCLDDISVLDPAAFNIIYAQANDDFMSGKIDKPKEEYIFDDGPWSLVAMNVAIYCLEQELDVERVLGKVRPKDFIPRNEKKWLSSLLFHQSSLTNLAKSAREAYKCGSVRIIKLKFIDTFMKRVAANYNYEVYHVYQIERVSKGAVNQEAKPELCKIRVRYEQNPENTKCFIELAHINTKSNNGVEKKHDKRAEKWVKICSVGDVDHLTLKGCRVQLANPDTGVRMFQFRSVSYAKSFISCIDGYYRLTRRWGFNLCREVYSPELKYLNSIGCHGPMGLHTTRNKLVDFKRPCCYVVRQSLKGQNKFLIDTMIDRVLLTIDVSWCPELRIFKQTDYSQSGRMKIWVKTSQPGYTTLKCLIDDLEIRYQVDGLGVRAHQLKYLIYPSDNDMHPVMVDFVSKNQSCDRDNNHSGGKNEPPLVLPSSSLNIIGELRPIRPNGLRTHLAMLNSDKQVITKGYGELPMDSLISHHTFHFCPVARDHVELIKTLNPSQIRLADWLFVKSNFFAETLGYALGGQLIQEYFPHGRLDIFLRSNQEIGQIVLFSASFQLAQALLFLEERHVIHGKIRCRNIMLKQIEPIQIKITDPLGTVDLNRDQAFIPIEYYNSQIDVCVKKFCPGIDIWAAGTTIWQIFNHGLDPPSNQYANRLTQLKCPSRVWNLVEGCWIVERNFRINPTRLHRDLFDLIAWEDGAQNYLYVDCSNSKSTLVDQDNISPTNTSSNSDLSTLDNIDSIMSTTTSTYSNNSDTILLKSNAETNQNNDAINRHTNHGAISNWAVPRMIIDRFKRCPRRNSMSYDQSFDDSIVFDRLIESFDTISKSETTNLTDIMDTHSLTEEFERYIWQVDSRRLKLGAEIGRGSSGIVIRGILLKSEEEEEIVAVKRPDMDCRNSNVMDDLKREFDILKSLDHRNIVKTLGYVDEIQPMLIFEFMPLGSLLSCIRNLPSSSDIYNLPLRKYALDIASGMEYLESRKIVHRDLALRNILLNDRHEAKICDFGLAKCLETNDSYMLETDRALPLKWYAPETLSTWVFTLKSDVWSYGVTLWEMFSSGDSPQYSGTYENLVETLKHERLPLPSGCSEEMYNLMLACWAYSPEDRKTFGQICAQLA